MFKIYNEDKIKITQGDTGYLTIKLKDDEQFYNGDSVIFAIKENANSSEYLFSKTISITENSNSIDLKLEKEDTINLSPGGYYYLVQLVRENGDKHTIICYDKGPTNGEKSNFENNFYVLSGGVE